MGLTELCADRRQERVKESSQGPQEAPVNSQLPASIWSSHFSTLSMVLGCAQSPQWRQLVLGNHCHSPIQPCCITPSVLSITGGFWQYLKSRRKGIQRGAQVGWSISILVLCYLCLLWTAHRSQVWRLCLQGVWEGPLCSI